jgi:hypothetical protein
MKAHAALPYRENFQRIGQVVARFVEQAIADAPTEHHTKNAVQQQVIEIRRLQPLRIAAAPIAAEQQEHGERREIHQPVPAHRQRADLNGDRSISGWMSIGFAGRKTNDE